MTENEAEIVALKAMGWLAAEDELLPVFLGHTGASVDDLKTRVQDPDFLIAILSFLTMDDAWVLAFTDAMGLSPDTPLRALQALPGGAEVNWT